MNRIGIALAALGTALIGLAPDEASAAREIRYSFGSGTSHAVYTHAWPAYTKAVETASKGELTFKMFAGGALLNLQATLDGLKNSVADAGFLVMTLWPAQLPNQKLLSELALLGDDGATMLGAVSEFTMLQCADCQAELAANKVVLTSMFATGVYVPWARQKITSIDDFKGKKIRSGGALWNRWAVAMGAVPASVSGDEQYDALNRGLLDITIASVATGKNYNLWDVAKTLTMLPLGTFHSVSPVAYGADFWKGLTAQERSILLKSAVHAGVGATRGYYENDQEVLKLATSKGLQVYQPDSALLAASAAFARKDLEVVEAEANKYGVRNAKAKIDSLVSLIDKWRRLAPPANYDHAKLVEIMQAQIYNKIDATKYGL